MHMWHLLTAFGDCAVLLPLTVVAMAWLISRPATRHNALLWGVTIFSCGALVTLSKLIYMGWGLGIPGLDFTGFSGHTALSSVIWPGIPALLISEKNRRVRWIAVALGVLLAMGVAVSRLGLGVHSVSEVVLGGALGFSLMAGLLFKLHHVTAQIGMPSWRVCLSLLLPLLLCYGRTFPSQHLLKDTAAYISGHASAFTRESETR